jgi:hypothetical protein
MASSVIWRKAELGFAKAPFACTRLPNGRFARPGALEFLAFDDASIGRASVTRVAAVVDLDDLCYFSPPRRCECHASSSIRSQLLLC